MKNELPAQFLALLDQVTGRRARIVVNHILEHGFITTEVLEAQYGYKHPPRAIRDVREQGVPIDTYHIVGSDGRRIAAYRFGAVEDINAGKLGGRKVIPKAIKSDLIARDGASCTICGETYAARYLQVDHKIPYEVSGELLNWDLDSLMLVCGSCNRAKSWSCEHCDNFQGQERNVCTRCYWASPEDYDHVALRLVRRLDLTWADDEVNTYEAAKNVANLSGKSLRDYVKQLLAKSINKDKD